MYTNRYNNILQGSTMWNQRKNQYDNWGRKEIDSDSDELTESISFESDSDEEYNSFVHELERGVEPKSSNTENESSLVFEPIRDSSNDLSLDSNDNVEAPLGNMKPKTRDASYFVRRRSVVKRRYLLLAFTILLVVMAWFLVKNFSEQKTRFPPRDGPSDLDHNNQQEEVKVEPLRLGPKHPKIDVKVLTIDNTLDIDMSPHVEYASALDSVSAEKRSRNANLESP